MQHSGCVKAFLGTSQIYNIPPDCNCNFPELPVFTLSCSRSLQNVARKQQQANQSLDKRAQSQTRELNEERFRAGIQ